MITAYIADDDAPTVTDLKQLIQKSDMPLQVIGETCSMIYRKTL